MNLDDFEKLANLHEKGILTDAEYAAAKQKLLAKMQNNTEANNTDNQKTSNDYTKNSNQNEFSQTEDILDAPVNKNQYEKIVYNTSQMFWGMAEKTFCTMLHLSVFAGVIIPYAGFVLPFVMWLTNKDFSMAINRHGKMVCNAVISYVIYSVICGILSFALVGIPLLIALVICGIVFSIIGAIRASEGELYQYPLVMPILK